MIVIGISYLYHDSACALVLDEQLVAAAHDHRGNLVDVLAVPEGDLGVGHITANFTPGRCYLQSIARTSRLAFQINSPIDCRLEMTYRMHMDANGKKAEAQLNGTSIGTLSYSSVWCSVSTKVPAQVTRAGVNHLEIRWPVETVDFEQHPTADASALSRGTYPQILPIFGENISACLVTDSALPRTEV